MQILSRMLPPDCRPIIVSDAGFRVPWFKLVASFGWDWIGRVRNRTLVHWVAEAPAEAAAWLPCKSLYPQATGTPTTLGAARLARSNPLTCQLILYKNRPKGRVRNNHFGQRACLHDSKKHAAREREPWLLATSLPRRTSLAKNVVASYRQRMQIEESFRDLKSTRFGLSLELHRTWQVERLQVLLLIATLAWLVAWLLGKATELTDQHWQYQANTVRNRTVLSTIFIGLKMINDRRIALTAPHLLAAWRRLHDIIQSRCLFDERDERTNEIKQAA